MAWMLQPPGDRVQHAVPVGSPLLAAAEGQLVDAAHDQPVRHVGVGRPLLIGAVGGVQQRHLLGELRPGVGHQDRVAAREPLLQAACSAVVPAGAVVRAALDVGELRVRQQQLLALDRRAVQVGARQQAPERVGHVGGEVVDGGLVARPASGKVVARHWVEVGVDRQVGAPVADVGDLDHPLARQLALDADGPAHRLRRSGKR